MGEWWCVVVFLVFIYFIKKILVNGFCEECFVSCDLDGDKLGRNEKQKLDEVEDWSCCFELCNFVMYDYQFNNSEVDNYGIDGFFD